MRIGFMMKWPKQSSVTGMQVIGDELYSESLCKAISRISGVESAEVFAPNRLPREKQDFMIYLNDQPPEASMADRHVLYLQNGYNEGSDRKLRELAIHGYDGFAFISNRLLETHIREGRSGIFLPFGVDTSVFYPRNADEQYAHEVAYVGNDIKGINRTERFILPAARFKFGLYGSWGPKVRPRLRHYEFMRNVARTGSGERALLMVQEEARTSRYRRILSRWSLGKIPQEDVPTLYSSAKINLNCSLQDCVDWDVITLRTFEVLACRGFLISDAVPSAERLLHGGMVFTTGGKDLVQKVRRFLEDEKERERIAQVGFEYTIENATIDARATELIDYLRGLA